MGRSFNVKKLNKHPNVEMVEQRRIQFSFHFRISLFEEWKKEPGELILQKELRENDIFEEDVPSSFYRDLNTTFKMCGYPLHNGPEEYNCDGDGRDSNPLLLSGKFFRLTKFWGLGIDPEFKRQLQLAYPEASVRESLSAAGINPLDVGYNRIYKLEKEFSREASERYEQSEKSHTNAPEARHETAPVTSHILLRHPYVKGIERGELFMTDGFFNETYLLKLPLSKIFAMYGIDGSLVNESSKYRIYATLLNWEPKNVADFTSAADVLTIQHYRRTEMMRQVIQTFRDMAESIPELPLDIQKWICRRIDELPRDPWGYLTKKHILELAGFTKSRYYALLNDESYGTGIKRRAVRDEEDIDLIRRTLAYKGFEKGIRQVYMLMPKITGQQFSMNRIRRLMNKYGIRTSIRRPSRNRKAMRELIERNRKANLLLRRFRLHRPNEVRLTDVTYLDYGDGLRAYGSASIDPVTGRLICFIVSSNNDLKLALDTLEAMDSYPAKSGAILHSDQGILYMTDDFQAAVIERSLNQSMSRRGNCWDNAPQESFFGHFKDECHYENCRNLEELRDMVDSYRVYYNSERGMWDRGQMTPAEYEEYLSGMDDDEFHSYLEEEERRYLERKEKSTRKAVQAAKEYKENTEAKLEEIQHEFRTAKEQI